MMHGDAATESPARSTARYEGADSRSFSRPRRVFIDCTATHHCDLGGGVQRLVRNLVNSAAALAEQFQLESHGVHCDAAGQFHAVASLPIPGSSSDASSSEVALATSGSRIRFAVRQSLAAVGMLAAARQARDEMLRKARRVAAPSSSRLLPGPGDLLLLADATWSTPQVRQAARDAQRRGAQVAAVIFDLIPLRNPEYCDPAFVRVFRGWWAAVRHQFDFVTCISHSVWQDVQRFLAADAGREVGRPPLLGASFRLGAGLDGATDDDSVRPELAQLFASQPGANPFLVAASFHERKNHEVVLDAFEQRWSQREDVRLVIVARKHGQEAPLVRRITGHPDFKRRLFWFHDISDAEMEFCYRRAAATIAASRAEGFDLPVVESLSRGRPVLASDIAVHREVAGARAAYFSAESAQRLADLLGQFQRGQLGDVLAASQTFCWPDWNECGTELMTRVLKLYEGSSNAKRIPCEI